MSFLSIQRLSKSYKDQEVFKNIDFVAERGELITLLGPSGCGKSTLLRCVAGLTDINDGTVSLDGEDISNTAPQRRGIAMVFQSYALFPNMNVVDNVAFGLRMQRTPRDELKRRVTEVLELVELEDLAKRYPHQLSGGQRQRVALARSLVVRPRLLLLDEPLSALDARIRRHLREQIRLIQRELKLTTLFVTHDQEEALTMSDRIVLMQAGKIVQHGSAEALYTQPANAFVAGFIGHYNLLSADSASLLLGQPFSQQVAIRPEAIELAPLPSSGSLAAHALEGEVLFHSLLGNIIRYFIKVKDQTLTVDILNRSINELYSPGSPVQLIIPPAAIQQVS